jgi:adenylate kinase family enzyme
LFQGDITVEKNFVDQELFQFQNAADERSEGPSLRYLRDLMTSSEKDQPVNVILGGAGVGKSTLCEKLVSMVNKMERKRALYISSTDLKNARSDRPVESVADLYRLYVKTADFEASDVLETENLEINISCGNIVLIIDGLDEIESTLTSLFNLDRFIESAIALNDAYRSCSIIITSRDYYRDRYAGRDSTRIFTLLGFTGDLVEQYLEKRSLEKDHLGKTKLPRDKFGEAKRRLEVFKSHGDRYIPLYLSLICDLIEREQFAMENAPPIEESKYFYSKLHLDKLLYELLAREIDKQSLSITCDEYYEVLAEIVISNHGQVSKEGLNEIVESFLEGVKAKSKDPQEKFPQFYVSPLLHYDLTADRFMIKYDFVELWTKVRFIWNNFERKDLTRELKSYFAEMFDGSSPLLRELIASKEKVKVDLIEVGAAMLKKLVHDCEKAATEDDRELARKAISGFLYLMLKFPNEKPRSSNTETLVKLFDSRNITQCHVFGPFVALDFTDLQIFNSSFDGFENLDKCLFPKETTVFFNSNFSRTSPTFEATFNSKIFDPTCVLNEELRGAFGESLINAAERFKQVQDNISRILRVGYKGGVFSPRHDDGKYRGTRIKGRGSIDDYLHFLVNEGVLVTGSGTIGRHELAVSVGFQDAARYLITNSALKPQLEIVVKKMVENLYGI